MLRHTVGLVGLLAALYSGIGWMSNLRAAVSEQQCALRGSRMLHMPLTSGD